MKKRIFITTLMTISLSCMPALASQETATEYVEDYVQYATHPAISETFIKFIADFTKSEKFCTGDFVNVREAPGTDSEVLGQLMKNVTVEVIAEHDGWSCITTQDGIAFVASKYLSEHPVPEAANRWGVSLSDQEMDTICRIVMLESGGESDLGQQAVTEVILNRVSHPEFPNDVISVLGQRDGDYAQFSTWKNRNSNRAIPSNRVRDNVAAVLRGETNILPGNTVYFSRGPQNRRIQARIGNHVFCNR